MSPVESWMFSPNLLDEDIITDSEQTSAFRLEDFDWQDDTWKSPRDASINGEVIPSSRSNSNMMVSTISTFFTAHSIQHNLMHYIYILNI